MVEMAHLRIVPAGFENRPAGDPAGLALIQVLPSEFVTEPAFEFLPVPFERCPVRALAAGFGNGQNPVAGAGRR